MKQIDTYTDDMQMSEDYKPTYINEQHNNNCQQFFGPITNSTFVMPSASPSSKQKQKNETNGKVETSVNEEITQELKEDTNNGIPTGVEAEENDVIIKYDHFVDAVKKYKFLECPAVACLNREQRCRLVRKIVNRHDSYGAYAVAMLCELNYDQWMMDNFAKDYPDSKRGLTKTVIFKHWRDALSLANTRAIAGNYNVIRNPYGKEDKAIYKASEYTKVVHDDYMTIKGNS